MRYVLSKASIGVHDYCSQQVRIVRYRQLQMGSNTSNDLEPVVLVDQTSAGELSNKTMAKDFFEAALVMVVAAGGRIILPSHINQNVHVLPYCRITAANRAHFTTHAEHRGKSHPRVASVTQTYSPPVGSSLNQRRTQRVTWPRMRIIADADLRVMEPFANCFVLESR